MTQPVYILGGFQTDFARNWTKEGKHISAMIREAVLGGLAATGVSPREIQVVNPSRTARITVWIRLKAAVLPASPFIPWQNAQLFTNRSRPASIQS